MSAKSAEMRLLLQRSLRELRDVCASHGLKVRGNKAEVSQRLLEYLEILEGEDLERPTHVTAETRQRPERDEAPFRIRDPALAACVLESPRRRQPTSRYEPETAPEDILDDDDSDWAGIELDEESEEDLGVEDALVDDDDSDILSEECLPDDSEAEESQVSSSPHGSEDSSSGNMSVGS